jgi:hypothetical protein
MSDNEDQHVPPQTQDEVKPDSQETVNIKVRHPPVERRAQSCSDLMEAWSM